MAPKTFADIRRLSDEELSLWLLGADVFDSQGNKLKPIAESEARRRNLSNKIPSRGVGE